MIEFTALGVGDAGEDLGVGGDGGGFALSENFLIEAGGFSPEAFLVVEAAFQEDGFVGRNAGDVAEGFGLENKFIEGGVCGGKLCIGGSGRGADFFDGIEKGGAGHLNLKDISHGKADLRGRGAIGVDAFDPEDVLVALDELGLEGRLRGLDGIGTELRPRLRRGRCNEE